MMIRPPQAGSPATAAGTFDQLTAIRTMSALAACSRVPALIVGLSLATDSLSESGPRLLAIVAAMPARDRVFAKARPILPAPMMPMLMIMFSSVGRRARWACRQACRLRRMVEKIVRKQFLEHLEIAATLHFLGVPPNNGLRGFAYTDLGHNAPPAN